MALQWVPSLELRGPVIKTSNQFMREQPSGIHTTLLLSVLMQSNVFDRMHLFSLHARKINLAF